MSPDEIIGLRAARQHGAFARSHALDAGLTPHGIKHRRDSGRWRDLHRGVYAIAGAPHTEEQRIIAAAFFRGDDAVVASTTAAWLHRFVEAPSPSVHLVMPPGQHRRSSTGIIVVQARLERIDVRRISNIPVTSPNRTIVDAAGALSLRALEACLDEAILLGRTSAGSLRRYIKERRLEHRPGARELKALLDDRTQGVTQKELERLFLRRIRASGLPDPGRQHPVGKRKIDFAYPQAHIAIELDSLGHHFSGADFRSDRRRQNEIVLAGWTPLRFTWDDVNNAWPRVERTIRDALGLPESR